MKNLKKVLALVLAFAMAFTMVISATAFTDDKAIATDNQDAVNVMTALGVIKGYEDSSFKPEGNVTRAEMAKMIYVIRSGGSDDASSYANVPTKFTDLGAASWASGYIKYCETMGIIAGKSATKFDPNGKVTMAETAKMALVVLGYKAEKSGLTGAQWLNNTLNKATENDLLVDTKGVVTEAATRQEAGQVLYNMLDADCVVWSNDIDDFAKDTYTVKGGDKYVYDAGYKYLGLEKYTGTYMGDENSYGCSAGEVCVKGHLEGTDNRDVEANFPAKFDNTNMGQKVTVLFKDSKDGIVGKPDKKDNIYGLYLTEDTSSFTKLLSDIDDDATNVGKVIVDDVKYKVADKGTIIYNYNDDVKSTWNTKSAGQTAIIAAAKDNSDSVKFILNDNDEIETLYITNYYMAKVTSLTSTKITLSGVGSFELAENDNKVESGIAKDDVVVATKLYDADNDDATFNVVKAKTVSGELTAFESKTKDGKTTLKKVAIDGNKYDVFNYALKDNLTDDYITTPDDDNLGDKVTIYLANGWAFAMNADEEEMKNYAVVTGIDEGTKLDVSFKKAQVELKLADGTKKTVYLHKDSKLYKDTGSVLATGQDIAGALELGTLVKYSTPSDTEYKLTEIGSTATPKLLVGDGSVVYNKDTKSFKGTVTSSDCVLFVQKGTDWYSYKIRGLDDVTVATGDNYSYYVKDGKVVAAFAQLDRKPSGSSNAVYAIVDKNNGRVKVDGDYYNEYIAYDKAGTKYTLHDDANSYDKKSLISFEPTSDGTYSAGDVTCYSKAANTTNVGDGYVAGWAKEYEAKETLTLYTKITEVTANKYYTASKTDIVVLPVDDDVKVVYVDVDNHTIGDDIGIGEFDSATGYKNVLAVMDEDAEKVVAIFVETSKKCDVFGKSDGDAKRGAIDTFAPVAPVTPVETASVSVPATVVGAYATQGVSGKYEVGETVAITMVGAFTANTTYTMAYTVGGVAAADPLVATVGDADSTTLDFLYTVAKDDAAITLTAVAPVAKKYAVAKVDNLSYAGKTFDIDVLAAATKVATDTVTINVTADTADSFKATKAYYLTVNGKALTATVGAADASALAFTYTVTGKEAVDAKGVYTLTATKLTGPVMVSVAESTEDDTKMTGVTVTAVVAAAKAKGEGVEVTIKSTGKFIANHYYYVTLNGEQKTVKAADINELKVSYKVTGSEEDCAIELKVGEVKALPKVAIVLSADMAAKYETLANTAANHAAAATENVTLTAKDVNDVFVAGNTYYLTDASGKILAQKSGTDGANLTFTITYTGLEVTDIVISGITAK